MKRLGWTETLSAPRSLATRELVAVTIVEDPGALDIRLHVDDDAGRERLTRTLGSELPTEPWRTSWADGVRIVWIAPGRWRVFAPRDRVAGLLEHIEEAGMSAAAFDLTGAFASFRIVGKGAFEILVRVCPLDLGTVQRDEARGTKIARVPCLLIEEVSPVPSWIVYASRSYAGHVAGALIEAARTPGRLALFEPALAPLV